MGSFPHSNHASHHGLCIPGKNTGIFPSIPGHIALLSFRKERFMTSLAFMECCQRLSVTPKTLRQWLAQAEMSLHPHPTDARITCLTSEQLQLLAALHGRVLQPLGNPLVGGGLGPGETTDAALRTRLAQLEAQVATLQTQLSDLTFQLLREREQRTEQRLLALEAELASADPPSGLFSGAPPAVPCQSALPALVCHPTEKRHRLVPLIEYGAKGRYVLISPEEGELPITPDSPEWFSWLASLASFRFVGKFGRFSARRGYNQRPNRGWYAQRTIHQQFHGKYIGVSEHITIARLEQIAAHFQSYMQ
jgi:hypothetical protein